VINRRQPEPPEMKTIHAVWKNGQIVPMQPVDWPEGTELEVGPIHDGAKAARERFSQLATRWKDETLFMSSTSEIHANKAYEDIIQLGDDAVPEILAALETEPDHWFMALRAITGANPVALSDSGDIQKMATAWIAWGKAHGYRW
jgi:hypothetical protein